MNVPISKTNGKDAVNLQIIKLKMRIRFKSQEMFRKVDEFVKNNHGMTSTKTMDTAKPIQDSLIQWLKKQH